MTKVDELLRLTQVVLDGELAAMQDAALALTQVQEELEALKQRKTAVNDQILSDETLLPAMVVQGGKWISWAQKEQARINRELSIASAALEAQREKTRTAFGRVEALKKLREHGQQEARRANLARLAQL